MDVLNGLIDIVLHVDKHLAALALEYGAWVVLILFLIIFLETGVVIFPFLPGDSLLFVSGAVATAEGLNVHLMVAVLIMAAILGDTLNYSIGKHFGGRLSQSGRWIKPDHLARTQAFYERHGGKTIIIARFAPLVRTFAPFVAGIGSMPYARFLSFNVIGGILWVTSFVYAGYFFGNLPIIKHNLSLLILGIVLLSISPAFFAVIKRKVAS